MSMDIIKCRRSIRGYLPQPVPQAIVEEVLRAALRAPSAVNSQPWEITVASGEVLDRIKRDNVANILSGVAVENEITYQGVYKQRQVELAIELFKLLGIQREERQKRDAWLLCGYRFFDAPVAIILSADRSLRQNTAAMFDIGALAQTICLAALNWGLGTCIEAQGVEFPQVIRKHTGIAEGKDIIIGIALGYPDPEFPANKLITRRASVNEVTTWLGF